MIEIKAKTLDEAYSKAATELSCSVTEIDATILQYPSNGFLGFFKKEAVITVISKSAKQVRKKREPRKSGQKSSYKSSYRQESREYGEREHADIEAVLPEIETDVKRLFSTMCFDIEVVSVGIFDEKTVEIKFDGEDAALMIGKDGYRYKALSYVLFNWINPKYGLLLRLEVAEFLNNQEEMIRNYLTPVKETIITNGRGQTKVLDGVLVQIALKELRAEFPNKYVAIKTTRDGGKFIVVNDFNRSNG